MKYLTKYLALQMTVEKFFGATGNEPGEIVNKLALISRKSVIPPVMTVEREDVTNFANLLQLLV